jgi:endonuclease YncB( thermonuclease family)
MTKGLLEVSGTIDLAQFWHGGESDADTVKVLLSGPNAFRFTPNPGAPSKVTHAFEGATIKGKVSKSAIDNKNRVTIRLQGIDAPELHYRPMAPTLNGKKPTPQQRATFNADNGNFRQEFGETATVALGQFLAKAGKSPLNCVVRTKVDEPDEVFDTFGRLVGDIFVTLNGNEQNVNHWLCQQGWAFPTFYSSMTKQEITDLIALSEAARKAKRGIWKRATSNLSTFDKTLLFRKSGTPDPASDDGPVFLPKLFRRRSTFGIALEAAIASGSFQSYLKAVHPPDACFETAQFLSQGVTAATPRHLDEFVSTVAKFTVGRRAGRPADLVFQENPSHVIDKNGKPVIW